MKRGKFIVPGLIFVLSMLTACSTPVIYGNSPYMQGNTHSRSALSSHYEIAYPSVRPIEVTLRTGQGYAGHGLQPVSFIIRNGEYVEIPVRDRRGRISRIYAHYDQKNLHFDHGQNCRTIHGASNFAYDERWEEGYKYSRINVGKDYDLKDLQLQIRNVAERRNHVTSEKPLVIYRTDDSGHKGFDKESIGSNDKRAVYLHKSDEEQLHDRLAIKGVKVSFSGGTISINGTHEKFKKNSLTLREGDSLEFALVARSGLKFSLPVYYRNGTLEIMRDGERISYDPSWLKGKSYNIKTKANANLRDIQFTVTAI